MKIITKCVMGMKTSQIIYEKSHEYHGPITKCKGGGGGGSGKVDYPDYMETIHGSWLDNGGLDTITSSVTDAMNAAYGSSPWAAAVAYDPSADITAYEAAITAFAAILAGIIDTTDWASLFTQAETSVGSSSVLAVGDEAVADAVGITDAEIVDDVDAFADQLDDEIVTKVLPRFEGGMRDINAVVSSAFVIGRSVIEGFRDREVAKHASTLRVNAALKNVDVEIANMKKDVQVGMVNLGAETEYMKSYLEGSNQMLRLMLQRISFESEYMKTVIEGKRIKIVAEKEEADVNLKIDEDDALWDLETFQYGANVLASIGSGTSTTGIKKPSQLSSAIGGGLSGAVAGAMIGGAKGGVGGPIGAGIGAILGIGSSFL